MQSSKSPVTPRSKRTRGQTNKGANEQGGNNEPHLCVFCLKDENQIPARDVFCAAGAYHAKKTKLDRKHVEDLTAKLQRKAAGLGETDLLSRLSGGQDVGALEVFYHGNCLKAFNYKHDRYTASVSNIVTTEIQDNSVLLTSSLNLRKVTAFMVDSAAVEPGTMFKVQDF